MRKKTLTVVWIIWMVIYNAFFIWFLVRYQAAGNSFVGLFPVTFIIYLIMLIVIAVVNWTIGWQLMKPESRRPRTTE